MERKDSGTRELNLEFEWDEKHYNSGTCFCYRIPTDIPKGKICLSCPQKTVHIKLDNLEIQDDDK